MGLTAQQYRPVRSGTLTSSTPVVISIDALECPFTVTLNTTYASKLIELSTDGGVLYFTPTYATSNASQLIVSVASPISHVRLTGQNADIWSIR